MEFIRENKVLEKLKKGEPVYYSSLGSRSPLAAELMGCCGVDYVRIEAEHKPYNTETLERCIWAVQLGGAVPVVRLPGQSPDRVLEALEAGAMGIQIPHVDTAEEARKMVDAIRFAPLGERGFSDCSRAAAYGMIPAREYIDLANRNIIIIAQIESARGVENIDEIVQSGVDIITQGPKDLSVDMGFWGEQTKEVKDAIARVHDSARRAGIPYVAYGYKRTKETFVECYREGARIFSGGLDMNYIRDSLRKEIENFTSWKQEL